MLVITSNYAARKYGINKGDSLAVCRQKCPQITICNGEDLTWYREVSLRVFDVAARLAVPVERLGMDELFIDVTSLVEHELRAARQAPVLSELALFGCRYPSDEETECTLPNKQWANCDGTEHCLVRLALAAQISKQLRQRILSELGLTSSAGISVNKLLAKLVASENKPNKQTVLVPTAEALGLALQYGMPVQRVPGIGFSATRRWNAVGVCTCGQLWQTSHPLNASPEVRAAFSDKELELAHRLAAGLDDSQVKPSGAPKSIGAGWVGSLSRVGAGAEDSFWSSPLQSMEHFRGSVRRLAMQIVSKWQQDDARFGQRMSETCCVSIKQKSEDPAMARRQSRQSKHCTKMPQGEQEVEKWINKLSAKAEELFCKMVGLTEFALHILNVSITFRSVAVTAAGSAAITSFFTQRPAADPGKTHPKPPTQPDQVLPSSKRARIESHELVESCNGATSTDASWECAACTLSNSGGKQCKLCGALRGSNRPCASVLSSQSAKVAQRKQNPSDITRFFGRQIGRTKDPG